ncbi:hypothetical protein P3342_008352 [Pyrenophora teres f. teres]|uniref:Uncharacterized protein n=2 Tax=Pyrenophora teres f. teres TaxID=97479 RepID=E3RV12_PYRTT|nr:hypothetical protein PTT_12985 [Pyrenophora teres f. teres 0-1]KAE8827901.1 hypothetical protein HRS9139_07120 [Pyrenophora teres f. teres]KAE8829677.1 hypothetical protein HRS9122_09492 [Pyrenophora teres f. teres]KAE8830497.1 hypothetical protein PTNB85_07084 [Pyrenophora teres f. teres]KAE8857503.1 hypothetical protein PTNB29_08570 [Pyrenophora teres f. teres]
MSASIDTAVCYPSANGPPVRVNSFFTHLNLDVRCMIYDLLELPPVSNANLGLVLSCKQAYVETETSAVRNFNRLLKKTEAEVAELETTKAEHETMGIRLQTKGARLEVSPYPFTSKFSELRNLTIGVSWPIIQRPILIEQLLACHLSKLTLVAIDSNYLVWEDNGLELEPMKKDDFFHEVSSFFIFMAMPHSCVAGVGNPFRFYGYKAKSIELIWGTPPTQTTTNTFNPIHFGFQNRTAVEKANGRKFATVTGVFGHERGLVLLEYDGPWKKTFDDRSYQRTLKCWGYLWHTFRDTLIMANSN